MTEGRQPDSSVDIARARQTPTFLIVDDTLAVTFSSVHQGRAAEMELPPDLRSIVVRLRQAMDASGQTAAIAVVSPTELVRVQRLDAKDGKPHYAVFREHFAERSSIRKAAERFKLSAREADVLQGLMRGDGTNELAARLGIAPTTVQEHIRNIGRKTNVTKRSEIVAMVFDLR